MKVKDSSCKIPSSMKAFVSKCDASFSSSTEDTQPFGLGLLSNAVSNLSYSS